MIDAIVLLKARVDGISAGSLLSLHLFRRFFIFLIFNNREENISILTKACISSD